MFEKKVKDIMTPIEDYPRIPHSSSIAEALLEFKDYAHKGYRHVLIFDERFQLVGILSLRDLLRNIEPEFLKTDVSTKFQGLMPTDDGSIAIMWEDAFFEDCKKKMDTPIKEILTPIKIITITSDAPVMKALYLMMREDVNALPVIEGDVVIGVIRLLDIVGEILCTCGIKGG